MWRRPCEQYLIRLARLAIALALCGPPRQAAAQRPLEGVIFDSLRAMRPSAGTTVRILGTSASTTSDASGRFFFPSVPDTAFRLGYWAPWFDSIGVTSLSAQVPAHRPDEDTLHVALSTPSLSSFQRGLCGAPLDTGLALIVGEVRDAAGAPYAGTAVQASWFEAGFSARGLFERERASLDTSTAGGRYSLCGVPIGTRVRLRAGGRMASRAELVVDVSEAIVVEDIILAIPGHVMIVTGRVVSESGAPVAGADVSLVSDSSSATRTDGMGQFVLTGVPRRSDELAVRALGFGPETRRLRPSEATLAVGDVIVRRLTYELPETRVGARVDEERSGFEERRRGANGYFITDDMLRSLPVVTLEAVAALTPRLAVSRTSARNTALRIRQGTRECAPRFFVDGTDNGRLNTAEMIREQTEILRRAMRVEVYTAATAPPRFSDSGGCGTVVVWTR